MTTLIDKLRQAVVELKTVQALFLKGYKIILEQNYLLFILRLLSWPSSHAGLG